jgi:hypothetical protein
MDLKDYGVRFWTGFVWLRLVTGTLRIVANIVQTSFQKNFQV